MSAASEVAQDVGTGVVVRELRFSGLVDLGVGGSLGEGRQGKSSEYLRAEVNEELAVLEAAVIGQTMSLPDLIALGDRVTLLLRAKGLLLARAYLPPQDVTDGVIEIAITQGTVGGIEFERAPNVRVNEALLRRVLMEAIDTTHLSRDQLEGALLRMADFPGVSARALLAPGDDPGTSRLTIQVDQSPVVSGALSLQVRNADSWTLRRSIDVRLIDVTGYGDETLLQGIFLTDARRLNVSSKAPIETNPDLIGTVSYDHVAYEALKGSSDSGLEGRSVGWNVGIERVLVRRIAARVRAGVDVAWHNTFEDLSGTVFTDKRVVMSTVSLSGDRQGGLGSTLWSLELAGGNLDLSRQPALQEADAAGLKTEGTFYRLRGSVTQTRWLNRQTALTAAISGQWASKNLDSSQQFILGGPQGVRAYPNGEARGDDGVLMQIALSLVPPVPVQQGRVEVKAFADMGWIRLHKEPGSVIFTHACNCNEYGLMAAGMGLSWTIGNLSVDATWAQAIGENPGRDALDGTNADGDTVRRSLWLSGSIRF